MANLFSLKEVPQIVRDELKNRGTIKGVEWTAKRFPWIHVTSMSSGCGKFSQLSSSTNGTIGTSYSAGEGYRPQPIVESVSVKKQGELGTTRSCTVNLKAFTDAQLVDLSKCYFLPGMTIRVQWGWSVGVNGAKSPTPVTDPLPDSTAICKMQSTAAGNPIYDGLQGLVTNFSYKLNTEGYWECSFEIVAASESVGGGKVATYNEDCECTRTFKVQGEDGESKDAIEEKSLLHTFFFDVNADAADGETGFSIYKSKLSDSLDPRFGSIVIAGGNYEGEDRDAAGGSAQSAWSMGNYDTTEGYISWRTLEAAINRYALPTDGGKYILGRVASQDLLVKSHPKLDSGDPRICLIPDSPGLNAAQEGLNDWNWKGSVPSVWSETEFDFGSIMLNCIFLMQELKAVEDGDNKIHTFLTNVLKKVSNACGGYFTDMLEVVSTTEDCDNPVDVPTISIVDLRQFKPAPIFQVPSLPATSVIRDMTLDLQLTGAMKTQALYSNGAKQNAKGAKCDAVVFRPFGLVSGAVTDKAKPRAKTAGPCDCEETPQQGKSEKKALIDVLKEMYACVDNGTTSAAISSITKAINGESDVEEKCEYGPLPFNFSFTCDGIGGFRFGQSISSDRIPSGVRSKFVFQITTVEHEINVQDWTTTVNTVARYKPK
jgi:hypothetical protein